MDIQWRTTDMTFSDDTLASKGLEIKKNSQLNRQKKKKVAEICSINWILSDSLPWIFLLVLKLTRMSHETPAAAACKHHIPIYTNHPKKTKKTNLTALTHFPKNYNNMNRNYTSSVLYFASLNFHRNLLSHSCYWATFPASTSTSQRSGEKPAIMCLLI